MTTELIYAGQCKSKFRDLHCVLRAGHSGRHRDRAGGDVSAVSWDFAPTDLHQHCLEVAEAALPCDEQSRSCLRGSHFAPCPARHRPAVAAALETELRAERERHEKQLRALVLEVLKHEFVWVKEPDKGQLVTEYGACSCGGLKADGVTPWKTLWKSHIDEIIKISLDRNHEQV